MDERILIMGISIGISGILATYLLFTIKIFKSGKFTVAFSDLGKTMNRSRQIRHTKRFLNKKVEALKSLAKQEKIPIVIITLLMIGTSQNLFIMPKNLVVGIVIGLIIAKLVSKIKKEVVKAKKLNDIAVLFEAIDMYTKAGYSLIQALRSAKLLTKVITPTLDKTIALWARGPQRALEHLKNELNLEESETLVLLMMHLEKTGVKQLDGVLKREARNIERLQRMKSEISISKRPLILTVYRILPLTAIFGIVIGSLIYRVVFQFQNMGIIDKF
ncbi:hypothetical protein [Wukongibacter baidiensis]